MGRRVLWRHIWGYSVCLGHHKNDTRLIWVNARDTNVSRIFSFALNHAVEKYGKQTSRKHLRTKVTPDFHLTYSKNGGNLGSKSK